MHLERCFPYATSCYPQCTMLTLFHVCPLIGPRVYHGLPNPPTQGRSKSSPCCFTHNASSCYPQCTMCILYDVCPLIGLRVYHGVLATMHHVWMRFFSLNASTCYLCIMFDCFMSVLWSKRDFTKVLYPQCIMSATSIIQLPGVQTSKENNLCWPFCITGQSHNFETGC